LSDETSRLTQIMFLYYW